MTPITQWNIRSILQWIKNKFEQKGIETSLLDAQLLICHALQINKVQLYMDLERPLNENEKIILRDFVKRRLSNEPVSYITNKKYWYDLELYVDNRVLIPRPETECILDHCYDFFVLKNKMEPKFIFDFCTGSGCLAIALARMFPCCFVVAVDVSQDALDVATKNIEKYKLENRIYTEKLDLCDEKSFEYLKSKYSQPNLIVANPPYVTRDEWKELRADVKNFEPQISLVDEEEGLKIAKKIVNFVVTLNSCDFFIMELSPTQPKILKTEISLNSKNIENQNQKKIYFYQDLDGNKRFFSLHS